MNLHQTIIKFNLHAGIPIFVWMIAADYYEENGGHKVNLRNKSLLNMPKIESFSSGRGFGTGLGLSCGKGGSTNGVYVGGIACGGAGGDMGRGYS